MKSLFLVSTFVFSISAFASTWEFRPVDQPDQHFYVPGVVGSVSNPDFKDAAITVSRRDLPSNAPKKLAQWQKIAREMTRQDFKYRIVKDALYTSSPKLAYVQDIEYMNGKEKRMEKKLFLVVDKSILVFTYDDSKDAFNKSVIITPYADFYKSLVNDKASIIITEAMDAQAVPAPSAHKQ